MTLTLDAAALAAALTTLRKLAMASRNIVPVLGAVHIVWHGEAATVTATDLDIVLSLDVPAAGTGEAVIEAAPLMAFAKAAGKGVAIGVSPGQDGETRPVHSMPDDYTVEAVAPNGARSKLRAYAVEDWPAMEPGEVSVRFEVPGTHLAEHLGRVAFAMSTEETRPYLCGVALAPARTPDGATCQHLVATDGHRLGEQALLRAEQHPPVIIPTVAVNALMDVLKRHKGPVTLATSGTKVAVRGAGVSLLSKLVDGSFPDWRRIVPSAAMGTPWTVSHAALKGACMAVKAMAVDKARCVRLTLGATSVATVINPEADSIALPVAGAFWRGRPGMEIAFNANYLLDLAKHAPGDSLAFMIEDPGSSVRIAAARDGAPVPGWTGVIMPMRV